MYLQKTSISISPLLITSIAALVLNGCATNATKKADPSDPWQSMNKSTQSFNDGVDKHILKPVAVAYVNATNADVKQGVTNFFSNINDIGVSINDFFQLKPLNGGMDFSRFLINSTVGVVGIFDVASKMDLPKHNEDFGQTLGVWGVPSGPYLVLPFFGPSSPRETAGLIGDAFMNPLTYFSLFGGVAGSATAAGANAVNVTDHRADLIPAEKVINEGSTGNRYDFIKSSYQQHRQYLINDGNSPDDADDPLNSVESDIGGNNGNGTKGKKAEVEVGPLEER
jgi:phospholipid-binding lipoprotein MlaA